MYVSACNIQPFTSTHVVESFYIFTLQIYPKVHATELQNTHHLRGQIAQAIKKHRFYPFKPYSHQLKIGMIYMLSRKRCDEIPLGI